MIALIAFAAGWALVLGIVIGQCLARVQVKKARQDGWDRGNEAMRREILGFIATVAKSPKQYFLLTDGELLFSPDCNLVLLGDRIHVNGLDAHKHEALIPDFAKNCTVNITCDPVQRRRWLEPSPTKWRMPHESTDG